MTTYNTGRPVPSADARDRYDNSQTFDEIINGPLTYYPNRKGANVLSMAGLAAQFNEFLSNSGYETPVDYAPGISITRLTQQVRYLGELYRPEADAIPFVTTTFPADEPKWISNGDNSLRQELASPAGTSLIGDGVLMLDERLARDLQSFAQIASNGNQLVDLHYAVLKATGWTPGEVGTIYTKPAVQVSNFAISVPDTVGFLVGQLLVYVAANGEYYTGVVIDITGLQVSFNQPIESPLGASSVLGNFYNDFIHPNINGYRAIADYALRRANREHKVVHTYDLSTTTPVAGGVQTPLTDNTYYNAGGSSSPALLSVAAGIGSGWEAAEVLLPAGDYLMRLRIASHASPGLKIANIHVVEDIAADSLVVYPVVSSSRAILVEIPFRARKGGKYKVKVQASEAVQSIITSKADVIQVTNKTRSLDYGRHVLFGDSWFNLPGILERLQERLPNATIFNKGVQGNKMSDLVLRYDADVAPLNPDFVWLMCGTNDYVANVTPTSFFTSFGKISSKTRAIGAAMLCFNSSVGPVSHPDHLDTLLPRSRTLVYDEGYLSELF